MQVPYLAFTGDLKASVSALWRLGGLPTTTTVPPRLRLGGDRMIPTPTYNCPIYMIHFQELTDELVRHSGLPLWRRFQAGHNQRGPDNVPAMA